MNAADFRRIALSLRGAEEGSHMGAPDFRVGGRIFATLASQHQGYGNLVLTPEQQAIFVEELPEVFVSIPRRMGKDENDPYSAGRGERRSAGGRSANSVEDTDREERKDRREEAPSATKRARSKEGGKETPTGREKHHTEGQVT